METHYKRVTQKQPLWVLLDPGNTDVKCMIHGAFGEEKVFPQAVKQYDIDEYRVIENEYRHQSDDLEDTAVFRVNGHGYVVGQHAFQDGHAIRNYGIEKYRFEQIGVCALTALRILYPEGHPDVHMVVTHPPKVETHDLKRMGRALKGEHQIVLPNGQKVCYNIVEIIPLVEPVAAFQSLTLTNEGKPYDKHMRFNLDAKEQFLVIDIGGWISSMVPGMITPSGRIQINASVSEPIRIGVQDVIERFQKELKSTFPDTLGRLQELPRGMMYNALINDSISIKGIDYPCAEAVAKALPTIKNKLFEKYDTVHFRGASYAGIAISGGGGGVTAHYLQENMLEHPSVYTVEEKIERMRFGAIRGASKGLFIHLRAQRHG